MPFYICVHPQLGFLRNSVPFCNFASLPHTGPEHGRVADRVFHWLLDGAGSVCTGGKAAAWTVLGHSSAHGSFARCMSLTRVRSWFLRMSYECTDRVLRDSARVMSSGCMFRASAHGFSSRASTLRDSIRAWLHGQGTPGLVALRIDCTGNALRVWLHGQGTPGLFARAMHWSYVPGFNGPASALRACKKGLNDGKSQELDPGSEDENNSLN